MILVHLSARAVRVGVCQFHGAKGVVNNSVVGLVCSDGQNGVPHHGSLLGGGGRGEGHNSVLLVQGHMM